MMYPLLARSVRAQGRARRRLLLRPRSGSGEDAIPPETEVEAESRGRARRRLLLRPRSGSGEDAIPPETEAEAESGVGRGGDLLPRPEPEVGRGGDLLPRPEPKVGRGGASCCAQGRTRWLIVTCCRSSPGWLARHSERGGWRCFPVISDSKEEGRSDCGHFGLAD
jgi:hypothetical protein